MARPTKKEAEVIKMRNKKIFVMAKKHYPLEYIANIFNISIGQVSKIVNQLKHKKQKGSSQVIALVFSSIILSAAIVAGGIFLKQKEMQSQAEADLISQEQPVVLPSTDPVLDVTITPAPEVLLSTTNTPSVPAETITPVPTPAPQVEIIQQQVNQVSQEQVRITQEQIRQSNCIAKQSLENQIKTLCHAYNFPGIDRCIEIRQKDIQDLKNYVPNNDQRQDGQDENYYAQRIQDEQQKVDQMIILKPQYEALKADCGN